MTNGKLIPVLPKNYRRIALYAIGVSTDPAVVGDRTRITDYSETGVLTQKGIRQFVNFEIRDGNKPILGFHDHPNDMWVSEQYAEVARYCESKGWLKVQKQIPDHAINSE